MGEEQFTEDRLKWPQIGDIWKIGDHYHYLIVDEEFDEHDGTMYTTYILERDMYDCLPRSTIEAWGSIRVV